MQNRKFLIPILAVLLVGVAVPLSVQRAHGDDNNETLNITGLIARGTSDSYLGGGAVDVVQAGNTLTFNVIFSASSVVFQRNLTMGVKFDWMTNFQNSTSDVAVYAGQTVAVSLAYTIPALTGQYSGLNQQAHTWTLELWDMAQGATWSVNNGCYDFNNSPPNAAACRNFYSNGFPYTYHSLAVYSSAQVSSYNSKLQAKAIIDSLNGVLGSTFTPAPGTSSALASLAQANAQMTLGDNAYKLGDFATAQTDYQNALNDANSAQSSLATIGGGTDTATFTSIWLDSIAILLGGIGAILVSFAGFKYLRGKTRALPTYTPPTPKA